MSKRRNREDETQHSTAVKRTRLNQNGLINSSATTSSCAAAAAPVGAVDDHEVSSCCSSNGSTTENAAYCSGKQRTEASRSRVKNSTVQTNEEAESRRELRMPSQAEIDAYFASLEKNFQTTNLSEKYNFDFENEKPLEGKYVWEKVEKP